MIAVTGGTGLVGSHLLLELARKDEKIRALYRKGSDREQVRKVFSWYDLDYEELFNKIEWAEGDLTDVFSMEEFLEEVHLLYHCAAVVSFESRRRRELIRNNVEGTANLVNAALSCGVKQICHVSSNSALGKTGNEMAVTEETRWLPSRRNSGYSVSKFFSESEIWRGVQEGLEAVVVNPSIILGPGNWNKGSAAFFPLIDRGFRFYSEGVTGYVDVRDVVDALLLLTNPQNFELAKGHRFLLNAENISFRELFNRIADELGTKRPSVNTSGLLLEAGWIVSSVMGLITGKSLKITREMAASSRAKIYFDGSKITRMFDFSYRPIGEAIHQTVLCYLKEKESGHAHEG